MTRRLTCIIRTAGLAALAVVLVGLDPVAAGAQHRPFLAVSYVGTVYEIDAATGESTAVGRCSRVRLNSMARRDGVLYSASDPDVGPDTLVTVDPATGTCTPVVAIDLGAPEESVRGLAFAGPRLYLINNGGCRGCVFEPDVLYAFDIGTGRARLIGDTTFTGVQGLAFLDGVLYGWDGTEGLITVDSVTGLGTDVNPLEPATADIQTLAEGTASRLYGAQDQLYLIDPASGAVTAIGGGGFHDVRGMG
jgi:hypothetical protein